MTYTTELLENESGIQYQGVKDKSGGTGTYPITGLMTGIFKRGRFDKPMTITNENIRAQLGYDPKNSYYVAVQDALSSGVPSVQVLRLKGENVDGVCVGATKKITLGSINEGGYYDVVINKIHSYRIIGFRDGREDLKSIFALYGIEVKPLNSAFEEVISNGGYYNEVEYASFFHPANNHVDVKIATVDANSIDEYIVDPVYGRNETVVFETDLYDGVKFCLN